MESGDHASGDRLDALWESRVRPALAELEARRRKAVGRFWMILAGTSAVGAALAGFTISAGPRPPVLFVGVALLILGLGVAFWQLQGLRKQAKSALLDPVVDALGYRHQESGFERVAFDDCRRFSLLPGYDRSNFEDFIEGEHAGKRFQLYEAHLEDKRQSDDRTYYVTVFRGVIGRVEHESSALGETVFARDGGVFDGLMGPRGLERANMGGSAFEDHFTVWTSDQVEARYLLPPNVMAHLVSLEHELGGRKLRGAIAGGWLMFAVETRDLFEPGSMFRPMDDPRRWRRLMGELSEIRGLIDALVEVRP